MISLIVINLREMADEKTHLREITVLVEIYLLSLRGNGLVVAEYNTEIIDYIARQSILGYPKNNVFRYQNIQRNDVLNIIKNSKKLGKLIFSKFNVQYGDFLAWSGNDTQKEIPYDICVSDKLISLKEDSFILENMGLYKVLNTLTDKKYTRGLHIFKTFSKFEYNNWFLWTWNFLLSNLKEEYYREYNGNIISIYVSDKVEFRFNNIISIIPKNILSIEDFELYTNSITREKVFSKWINEILKHNFDYISLKKICSEVAGQNLVTTIKRDLSNDNISRFLQIYEMEYYYGKSDGYELKLFRVPSKNEFEKNFRIKKINYSVPDSQLNLIIEIENTKTNSVLVLRNECRFSHGQFNGTPEAKMYYEKGQDLSNIYFDVSDI